MTGNVFGKMIFRRFKGLKNSNVRCQAALNQGRAVTSSNMPIGDSLAPLLRFMLYSKM